MGKFQRCETLIDVNRYEYSGADGSNGLSEEMILLACGRSAIIRDTISDDADAIGALYERLTPAQRTMRFLKPTEPEVARQQGLNVSSITDPEHNYDLVVAMGPTVIGHAGFYLFGGRRGWGEMQFTVDPEFEGNGLCKKMASKVVEAAHDFGLLGLCASVKPGNEAMLRTFRKVPDLVGVNVAIDESLSHEEKLNPHVRILMRLNG